MCIRDRGGSCSAFDFLPDNVLLKILSFLPTDSLCRTSSVCRRFYFMSWDPSLWTEIHLSGEALDLDAALTTCLKIVSRDQRTSCMVQRVKLQDGCPRLSDLGLKAVATQCPDLRQLIVKKAPNLTNAGVADIVANCPNLTYLDLTGKQKSVKGKKTKKKKKTLIFYLSSVSELSNFISSSSSSQEGNNMNESFVGITMYDTAWQLILAAAAAYTNVSKRSMLPSSSMHGCQHASSANFLLILSRSMKNKEGNDLFPLEIKPIAGNPEQN